MQLSPETAAIALFAMLVIGSSHWRRRRIRRAMRGLPTRMQRLLGPDPLFLPPPDDRLPDELRAYAALHRRSAWVQYVLWGLAFVWIGYIIYSVLKGTPQ
ncbi:hypothetical protein Q4577_11600 [Marinovum sp. 2_MG-2023]|uniref:hypothetical protein n=1 Tax=unclassified Marinovum TaxID=2647166 RepID=UPI0026E283CA|nr:MULTISPECIES: hypothetical protein [unclassified Marinovum]MDO6730666.1 hypothetical protein [Marinovum sp. 2_MG-2023]MDO6778817.1 hypothetical protein [Marinovum sp. 1_MG-2023]